MGKPGLAALALAWAALPLAAQQAIDLENPSGEWQPLLAELSVEEPVSCEFEELRRNPFHRRARRFEGKMLYIPGKGLSLSYTAPGELIINVLADGVWIHRPGEPARSLPRGEEDDVMGLFTRLFSWDSSWLANNFNCTGEPDDGGQWSIQLRPARDSLAEKLTRIDLDGRDGLLERIFLDLKNGRSVEILLRAQTKPADPDEAAIQKAFPSIHE